MNGQKYYMQCCIIYCNRLSDVNDFASYLTIVISLLILKRQIKTTLSNNNCFFSLLSSTERKKNKKIAILKGPGN